MKYIPELHLIFMYIIPKIPQSILKILNLQIIYVSINSRNCNFTEGDVHGI